MNVKNIILNAEKWLSIQEYTKRHWLQLRIQISQIIYYLKYSTTHCFMEV